MSKTKSQDNLKPTELIKTNQDNYRPSGYYQKVLLNSNEDISSGRYRYKLYRFLSENIPAINACLNTWVRLSSAPAKFVVYDNDQAQQKLNQLADKINWNDESNQGGLSSFLSNLFNQLYRDGLYSGFVALKPDGRGVDRFMSLDSSKVYKNEKMQTVYDLGDKYLELNTPDYYYIALNSETNYPLGRSILQSIPFIGYVEQQLVEDMRRSTHNSGYHKFHVKITPPDRISGEADNNYIDRINKYFDSTVSMIKTCEIDENPVTWDNVEIATIGPENVRTVTNSWFLNHRAMIEEICAGTNLAPFLLGYSFGATSSWASLKFDIVMRQVQSIQNEISSFMEWMGNIELALGGFKPNCKFVFDNSLSYQATQTSQVKATEIDNILKLHQAGLLDIETAREKISGLL